jgi:phosphoglycolate phosphatase-like HAD superfamily hydrolase
MTMFQEGVKVYVFDLDGTLACGKHRLHLLPAKEDMARVEAWDEFNLAAADDAPIQDNIDLCNVLFKNYQHRVVILTGRSDVAKYATEKWLEDNKVDYDYLIMRSRTDNRKDTELKEAELKEIGLEQIVCCFDDLEHVVKHIRSLGVTCHQVTHYDEQRIDTIEREED